MKRNLATGLIILFCIFFFSARLNAADLDKDYKVILGLGVSVSTQPYTGVDTSVIPVPIIDAQYENLFIDGKVFGYVINDYKEVELAFVFKPRFMGYEAGDSSILSGMDEREWSLDAGLRASWDNQYFSLALTGLNDLLNRHQGREINLMLSKEFKEGFFTPRLGFKWLNADIIDYYYGVVGSEATADRPSYAPDSTIDFVAGFTLAYPIGDHWALIADFEYEDLGSDIEDSPIVDESQVFTYVAGVVYRF